eukprot:scaffold4911_cov72-Skeletonema_dohrnii-CCMP3373.AAC.1
MTKKQQTKALHLQKPQSTNSKVWGERKFGLRVWPSHPEQNERTNWLYEHLGAFHNSTKVMTNPLPNIVKHFNCEDGMDFLSASTQALIPFDHAEFLLSVAKTTYLEVDDFWGAKVLVLTAYLICESRMKNAKEIVECFKAGGEVDEDKLAEHLPWCYEAYNAVNSVDGMKNFLEQLDLSELKDEVAAAESTITLNIKDGHTKTEMKFNELINLNTVLKLSIEKKQKSIRLKHNGARVFLSSAGRKSLRQLGMEDNDVLEIEVSSDDHTVLQPVGKDNNSKEINTATSNRRKKKNKKKSKKNKSY